MKIQDHTSQPCHCGECQQAGVSMKFADQWSVEFGSTLAMIQCNCGDVFSAHGFHAEVSAKQHEWEKAHEMCAPVKREGSKVFWLSFCDADRPTGQQFLGACLVDVSAAEADEAAIMVMLRFPMAQPGAEWAAAATRKAHRLGCNPGGEVASYEISADNPNLSHYQRGVLMDRATIERIDAEIAAAQPRS